MKASGASLEGMQCTPQSSPTFVSRVPAAALLQAGTAQHRLKPLAELGHFSSNLHRCAPELANSVYMGQVLQPDFSTTKQGLDPQDRMPVPVHMLFRQHRNNASVRSSAMAWGSCQALQAGQLLGSACSFQQAEAN